MTRVTCVTHILIFLDQSGGVGDVLGVADSLVHAVGLVLGHGSSLAVHPLVLLKQVVEGLANFVDHF